MPIENVQKRENRILSKWDRILFQWTFIFFIFQFLPIDTHFFSFFSTEKWPLFSFPSLFYITRYVPHFLSGTGAWSLPGWLDLIFWGIVAAVVTTAWKFFKRGDAKEQKLEYWLRSLLRYRLALGIIGYGFLQLFSAQAPSPSLSNLNTPYGYFSDWKIFSLSLGIVPRYESFLGAVQILLGIWLVAYRKTAGIVSLFIAIFLGNVFFSNLAYNGGEGGYSLFLLLISLYLFYHDFKRLLNITTLGTEAIPDTYSPYVASKKWKIILLTGKIIFWGVFVLVLGIDASSFNAKRSYQFPATAGLPEAKGFYNVSTFKLNDSIIPYSETDTSRWGNVIFEDWNTISVEVNKRLNPVELSEETIFSNDYARIYENAGTIGRAYYYYTFDTAKGTLLLKNKNRYYVNDIWQFHFHKLPGDGLKLKGFNTLTKDSADILLNKIDKKYLLEIGRKKYIKI